MNYTFWPWLMITIGDLGNNAGAYLGTFICVSILKAISVTHQTIAPSLIGTSWLGLISYLEDILLASLLLGFMIFKPRGLFPEKQLRIPGINYTGIVDEDREEG